MALAAALYFIAAALSTPVPPHPFAPDDRVLVIAHRGGWHLGPEHTLPTYTRSVELGADVIELDVRLCKDSVPVVVHDRTVDRTTDGSGPVRDLTLAKLKKLDAAYRWSPDDGKTFPFRGKGYTIPTLNEIFTAFPDLRMFIELKPNNPTLATSLCHTLRDFRKTDQVIIASFDGDITRTFRTACPEVPTAATGTEALTFFLLNRLHLGAAFQPSAQAFQIPLHLGPLDVATPHFTKGARNHNMAVHVWTVNKKEDMQTLIKAGINGIITSNPQTLLELLN